MDQFSGIVSGREGGDKEGVGKKMNQCEKDIKLHSYEKQKKTQMFMEKQMFFLEKKNINLWQSEFDSICFLAYFLFFLLLYVSFFFLFFFI